MMDTIQTEHAPGDLDGRPMVRSAPMIGRSRRYGLWAAAEYGVANPIRMRRGWGRRRDGFAAERPVTAPSAVRDRDVKWFDPAGFVRFRDVGLMGFTVDGRDDPGFRGRNGQRDGAFADGLYGTGLRLQEWGSVLVA